jgi:hypothetical protein
MEEEYNRRHERIHSPVMIESGDFISAQRFASQKDAQRMLAEKQASGRVPPAGAAPQPYPA